MATKEQDYNIRGLPAGTMIQEYRLVRVLAQGSFGIIYIAENQYLPETVAIKEFLPSELATRTEGTRVTPLSSDLEATYQEALRKFLEEARTLFELSQPRPHRNIVRVTRYHEENDTGYIVMDYEQGEPLSEKFKVPGGLSEEQLRTILFPLLDGLETVHSAAVIHRDIKPDNILIRPDGSPVLIDFGAARRQRPDGQKSQIAVFTPDYAAPEQVYGVGDHGAWTDIYALGATLYKGVSGHPPTNASRRLQGESYQPAGEAAARPGYTAEFLAAIDAALELRPQDRPQSIAEWRSRFDRRQLTDEYGETIISPIPRPVAPTATDKPSTPSEPEIPQQAEHKPHRLLILFAVVGMMAAGGTAALFWLFTQSPLVTPEREVTVRTETTAPAAPPALPAPGTVTAPKPAAEPVTIPEPTVVTTITPSPAVTPESPPDTAVVPAVKGAPEPVTEAVPVAPTNTPDAPVVITTPESAVAGPTQESLAQPDPLPEVVTTEAPGQDKTALRSRIEELAAELKCARILPEIGGEGRVTLTGYVSSYADLSSLLTRVNTLTDVVTVVDNLLIHPPPFCQVIGHLSPFLIEQPDRSEQILLATDKSDGDYKEGELLIVSATASSTFSGYLYVDFFDSAGDVVHMLPSPVTPQNAVRAGEQVVLGSAPCPMCYEIAPPHGRSLLVAISSSVPLFGAMRPEIEKLADYLIELQAALNRLASRGDRIISTYSYIATHE